MDKKEKPKESKASKESKERLAKQQKATSKILSDYREGMFGFFAALLSPGCILLMFGVFVILKILESFDILKITLWGLLK